MTERERESNNQASWGKRLTIYGLLVALIAVASISILAIGMRSAIYQDKLFFTVRDIKRIFIPSQAVTTGTTKLQNNEFGQLIADSSKVQVKAPVITDRTIVAFVFGQSNSANSEGERYKAETNNVLNYFNGSYYIASDPLLGATGNAGSMWTITANKLIKESIADKVILVPAGVGGTSVRLWREGGTLNEMLEKRLKDAQKNNLVITHFLWHQGESDNNDSYADYESGLTEVIKLTQRYYPNSKFFVAQASAFCPLASNSQILKSQRDVTKLPNVYMGPNTDLIGSDDRYDGCHLSGRGVEKASNEWVELLKNPKKATFTKN